MGFFFGTERRVAPKFTIKPLPVHEVMLGDNLNLTCVAAGSPMPHVKWRKGVATDLTPEDQIPIGKNVLKLTNIQESENYTCIASSVMALIETTTLVKVQCEFSFSFFFSSSFSMYMFDDG